MEKLIPISMDGPNFNCDVLRKHSQNQKEREMSSVIELGSCELDIVHDTLAKWNYSLLLESSQSSSYHVEDF